MLNKINTELKSFEKFIRIQLSSKLILFLLELKINKIIINVLAPLYHWDQEVIVVLDH